ncbi:angiopoietin-related protein 2-like [Anopheles darlingi]|uniref:angiopoietin-related protein 2-like n=1 Tax=Anopheles darlingi TaxID=43151 RepID=UPI00210035D1|nr:angiopoietin-related protein 2-like [Anopheles darlingi]
MGCGIGHTESKLMPVVTHVTMSSPSNPNWSLKSRLLIAKVLHIAASEHELKKNDNTNSSADGMLGYGLDLLLIKLDAMENRLQKMESMQVQFQEFRSKQEEMFSAIHKFEHQVALSLSKVHDIIQQHTSSQKKSKEEMFTVLQKLENQLTPNLGEDYNQNLDKVHATLHKLDRDLESVLEIQYSTMPSSCKDVSSNVSETYPIRLSYDFEPFQVYCEQEAFDGGRIVMQYRFDGSLDFYRGWNEFRDGFGDLRKEFWLGLEKVHQITSGRKHELIVELKDFNGTYKYARFDAFKIGGESEQYVVKNIGKYSGTVGDRMSYYNGRKFSTKDRDNDETSQNCARLHEGAWWYWDCSWD